MRVITFLFIYISVMSYNLPLYSKQTRVAVMNFNAKGVSKILAQNVSELIRGEMINSGRYTVIERSQMRKILKEQGFQRTGCTDVSCAVEMGKILSARKILIGTVMKMGGVIVITGRIVDVKTATSEFSAKEKAENEKQLYSAVSLFVDKLTGKKKHDYSITDNSDIPDIPIGPPSIRTEKKVYKPYEKIVVKYSNLPGNQSDWITIVKSSEPPESYGECPYTYGKKHGKMNFKGLESGNYEVRVYYDWANGGGYNIQLKYPFKVK